jgi:shikimate kinase
MRCVVLIGPMGAGKTTLGKKLAKNLSTSFSDTDRIVEAKHGSISRIFETTGEESFRDYEEIALQQALAEGGVVATGGGVVLRESNRKAMGEHFVVFLDTNADSVLKRINLFKRPLLRDNPEKWSEIYNARLPLYKELSQLTIFTGNRPIKTILDELTTKVKSHGN